MLPVDYELSYADVAEKAPATVQAFKRLRECYADGREAFANTPESVGRTQLLEPVLTALGLTFLPMVFR